VHGSPAPAALAKLTPGKQDGPVGR
jgi:hypothetical protein